MKLKSVDIEGYRSISKKITLHFDSNVTVLLGANDHGKTNILDAVTHLNRDMKFDPERDLNWDHTDNPDEFPSLYFRFELTDDERQQLLVIAQEKANEASASAATAAATKSASAAATPPPVTSAVTASSTAEPDPTPEPSVPTVTLDMVPRTVECTKKGLTKPLSFVRAPKLPDGSMTEFMTDAVPRVEVIRAQETVPDSVTEKELSTESHEFMRGIFYYAGLEQDEFGELFAQTDGSMMRLEKAEAELNGTLRTNWSQGADLQFRLVHESKTDRIVLRIKDPAVGQRLVRASQRSSGFTHFFTLKTILNTRQKEHPANSYIFLFDEPGVFLHPAGQYDLLQVLETIGKTNQIVYSTHSLFMLNKTFPGRHRLIVKTANGTKLDGKPYAGRWGAALDALGLSLAGTILFAQSILLTEGDSDPMYIPAVLQKLVGLNAASIDLNAFSVVATETSRNTDALIRIILETASSPKVAVIVDGDDGGKARLKAIQGLLKSKGVPSKQLLDGTTIEDYLPLVGDLYVQAVADYVSKVIESQGDGVPDKVEFLKSFQESFSVTFEEGKVTKGVAKWAEAASVKLGKLDHPPSKLGIAREYVALLEEAKADKFTPQSLQRPLKLLEWIREILPISELRDADREILKQE